MKVVATRRFKAKDQTFILAAILEQTRKQEELPDNEEVVVIARRDLIWLQRLFRDLDSKYIPDYRAFKRKVKRILDTLGKQNGRPADQE